MATPKFDPNIPAGIGYGGEDAEGRPQRWFNQKGYRFDVITKELCPGQLATSVPKEARAEAPKLTGKEAGVDLSSPAKKMSEHFAPPSKARGKKKE